jgi:peptidoglycan/LPS O-acetylase OafA/YrhL
MYQDPWTYRFFPFELSFFLFGRIAYEIYFRIKDIKWPRIVLICLLAFTLAWTLLFDRIALPGIKYAYFSFMVLAIPFLFHLTREWKRDRWIGELSYPIYICHMLVFSWAGRLIQTHEAGNGTLTAFIAIVAAILLIRWVGNPIEAYRQRRISRQTVSVQIGQHLSANTV